MVNDYDVAVECALMHQRDEAPLKLRTFLAAAHIAPRVDFRPDGTVLGKRADLSAIACLGCGFPLANDPKIRDLFQTGKHGHLICVVDLLAARVVVAAFHVADPQRNAEMPLE